MTIAIAAKVKEGIVLASDSMATITDTRHNLRNFYDRTTKVFQLDKSFLVGVVAWGSSAMVGYPLRLLISDFRDCLKDFTKRIDSDRYTVQRVAERFQEIAASQRANRGSIDEAGFMIAGYSKDASFDTYGEVWEIRVKDGIPGSPKQIIDQHVSDLEHRGMNSSLTRLLSGFEPDKLEVALKACKISSKTTIDEVIRQCEYDLKAQPINDLTSIGNVVELAVFLVETATYYTRFCETGTNSMKVGGPAQVATITKDEGFRKMSVTSTRTPIYHQRGTECDYLPSFLCRIKPLRDWLSKRGFRGSAHNPMK